MSFWIFSFPLIAAMLGWLTHFIASQLIFYPIKPISFVGIRVQGIIPALQPSLANQLADVVSKQLSTSSIKDQLGNPENLKKIMPMVETHIDHFLRHKLQTALPMIAMFVGEKTIQQLKTVFMAELELIFPEVMNGYASQLEQDNQLAAIIRRQVEQMEPERLVAISHSLLNKQFRRIQLLGAVSGLIIGLVLTTIMIALS